LEEFESRNTFYKELIWVVNAQPLKDQFIFTNAIPNPDSPLLVNYCFVVDSKGLAKSPRFYVKDEYSWYRQKGLLRSFTLDDHELRVEAEEHGKSKKLYWLFSWKNKRSGWLNSNAPIFLDFGDESLNLIKKNTPVYQTINEAKLSIRMINYFVTPVQTTNIYFPADPKLYYYYYSNH
jgi:competence protein CoiA